MRKKNVNAMSTLELRDFDVPGAFRRIKSIRTAILDVPLMRPHRVSVSTIEKQSVVLVRIVTEDGLEGIGEGVVPGGPWWSGDTVEAIQGLVDQYLAPLLLGAEVSSIGYAIQRINSLIPGAAFAKAALEMALWDLKGKMLGLPVYELLGGAHRTKLPVTWALEADGPDVVAKEIREKLNQKIHASFKLKMGGRDPDIDVARIAAICQLIPAGVPLAVDLNGAWDEATSRRLLPALGDAGISMVEQPVPRWDVGALARLRQNASVRIMADESLLTVHDATMLGQNSAADVFTLKLAKNGGIVAVQRISAIAEAYGIACYGGTTIESSIGTAASVHAFCASSSLTAGTELFGPLLLADDLVEVPVRYANGCVHLTHGPGFGVTLDEDKVAIYTRRRG